MDRTGSLDRVISILRSEGLWMATSPVGEEDRPLGALRVDSRLVEPGDLFCAVRGVDADGHAFVGEAVERGAGALVVERDMGRVPVPTVRVSDGREAVAALAAEVHLHPWREVKTVGVTGTNGKTTTVFLLRALLGDAGGAGSIGTLGAYGPDGAPIPGTRGLTTPGAIEAAAWLRRFAREGAEWASIEVSSHALDQQRLGRLTLAAAVLTSLSRDHLDYHHTLQAYRSAKLRIIDMVEPDGWVVANADDAAWQDVDPRGRLLCRVGIEGEYDVVARDVRLEPHGTRFRLLIDGWSTEVRIPLIGTHNVTNALLCAGVMRGFGWDGERIARGLERIPQVPGRMEIVSEATDGPTVLIDYSHTPDAIERGLKTLRPLTEGRLIVVFGASGNRDRGKRPEMGEAAVKHADLAILTSDNPRDEEPEAIADDVERGMQGGTYRRILDRAAAIEAAITEASPQDIVLLAGKGHEWYQEIRGEKHPFNEAEIARGVLGVAR